MKPRGLSLYRGDPENVMNPTASGTQASYAYAYNDHGQRTEMTAAFSGDLKCSGRTLDTLREHSSDILRPA